MDVKLTDYLPAIDELEEADLLEARQRIQNYLEGKESFKEVDMRPNSVFGDLLLSPLAHLMAAFETGASRMFSDLNLTNVAAGTVYNCTFVKNYLNNFGQGQVYEYPSTGIVQVQFSSPETKLVDAGSKFIFASDTGDNYIYEMVNVEDILYLRSPYEDTDLNNPNEQKLKRVSESLYVANIPVRGPAGVGINSNTTASTDLPHSDLVGAMALGDFDRGTLPENIMELAVKVQKTFYAATLNNRTGAVSFLLQTFPELRGVSPVCTNDFEMLRDKENVLGIRGGKMDIYCKSRTRYLASEQELKLTYNNDLELWVGSTDFAEPPVWIDSVRRLNAEENSNIIDVYGKSSDEEKCPGLSSSYSKYETIGFSVDDVLSSSDTEPFNNVQDTNDSAYTDTLGVTHTLQGIYNGNTFTKDFKRDTVLYFLEVITDTDGIQKLKASLTDTVYSDSVTLLFKPSELSNVGVLDSKGEWNKMMDGLDIKLSHNVEVFSNIMYALVGTQVKLQVTGRGGTFTLRYRYDPNFSLVDKIISDDQVTPVNVDLVTKSFQTCYVYDLSIDYRKREGQNVDLIKAKEEIVNYVNKLTYPYVYEEYIIAEILLFYGAEGVQKIKQTGQFFRSMANKYELDGLIEDIDHPYSSELSPPDIPGTGDRNVNYILDSENIKFNAIII